MVFSFSLFLFLYREIYQNSSTSEQMQIAWQNEAKKREELKSLDSSLKNIESEVALLETHFIKSSDIVPFLDMIEKLAPRVGAKAEVVLVDLPKDNSGLIVEVKATGFFEALYKFLTLLENSSYEIDVISMDMQKLGGEVMPDKKKTLPEWSATFRVKLLSFI